MKTRFEILEAAAIDRVNRLFPGLWQWAEREVEIRGIENIYSKRPKSGEDVFHPNDNIDI